jgi:hypothetical protein
MDPVLLDQRRLVVDRLEEERHQRGAEALRQRRIDRVELGDVGLAEVGRRAHAHQQHRNLRFAAR